MNNAIGRFSRPLALEFSTRLHGILLWLGVHQVIQREWRARLPAVFLAGALLAIFAWATGMEQKDLFAVPVLALVGAVLSVVREISRKPAR